MNRYVELLVVNEYTIDFPRHTMQRISLLQRAFRKALSILGGYGARCDCWYQIVMLKRAIDIVLAVTGLVLIFPVVSVVAILLKLDSKGPIFYSCDRVGLNGRLFKMYKFRTLYDTAGAEGPSVCPAGDLRVTPMGHVLRRTKLNELPQLFNILKGDMSFVGPRPEAPDLAAYYPQHARAIFTVKPGLVGPNQILTRHEEEWYPPGADPQQYYIESILPQKLPVDLAYVNQSSAWTDLKYLWLGAMATLKREDSSAMRSHHVRPDSSV